MDFRSTLNNHPGITAGIVIVLAGLAVALASRTWFHAGASRSSAGGFYTDDDGQMLFSDVPGLITPFDHNGKQAVKAMVLTADGGQHHWVQFLEKYTDESAQKLASAAGGARAPTAIQLMGAVPAILVKKPGAEKWISINDPAARQLMQPTIPDGMGSGPIELAPQ